MPHQPAGQGEHRSHDRIHAAAMPWRRHAGDHAGRLARAALSALLSLVLLAGALAITLPSAPTASAESLRANATASCASLASANPTATNGASWGKTLLKGFGAKGGWFGVDVCSNGYNARTGFSVSCNRVPVNWNTSGCAPGGPTRDAFGWTFQCVELIVRFAAWAFGDTPGDWGRASGGNAPDLWLAGNHPSDWVMYPNGSSTPPVPGDVLVWGALDGNGNPWPAGPDGSHGGHNAVVAAVKNGKVITAEQNVLWGAENHPSDELALTKAGSRWILSGTTAPVKTLPTYRWPRTMGQSRGTYGWLHNVKNTGTFPAKATTHVGKSAPAATPAAQPTPARQPSAQKSGGLPALSQATIVTSDGQLADLTWTTQRFYDPKADDTPRAQPRSLGAPPGVSLASPQTPSTIVTSDDVRYSYVIGEDGQLYTARAQPSVFGTYWIPLGAPDGVKLKAPVSASLFSAGAEMVVRGNDGTLWWRAGPPDRPGDWTPLGAPEGVSLTSGFVLSAAPGTGSPLLLATGDNGTLYQRVWQEAATAADGSQVPAGWSDWLTVGAQPKDTRFDPRIVLVPELPSSHNWIGSWADTPVNALLLDANGGVWWLRSTRLSAGWTWQRVSAPSPVRALLDGVATPLAASDGTTRSALQVYAVTADATYVVTVRPADGKDGTAKQSKPEWKKVGKTPTDGAAVHGAAVALGESQSALVLPDAGQVALTGLKDALVIIAPDAEKTAGASGWVRLANPIATASFSDGLTSSTVDGRWVQGGKGSRATAGDDGLTLRPGSAGVASLTQGALAGEAAVTVRINNPQRLVDGASAGILLYTDDADWLTLTADAKGTVTLCAVSWGQSPRCDKREKVFGNKDAALWLRVQRTGDTYTAQASVDGSAWTSAGQWTPAWPGDAAATTAGPKATPSPTPSPAATPRAGDGQQPRYQATAPLAFTAWGVLVRGASSAKEWPLFSDFTLTVEQPV